MNDERGLGWLDDLCAEWAKELGDGTLITGTVTEATYDDIVRFVMTHVDSRSCAGYVLALFGGRDYFQPNFRDWHDRVGSIYWMRRYGQSGTTESLGR